MSTKSVEFNSFVVKHCRTAMKPEIECPVDFVTINENKVRVTAFFVFVLSLAFLYIGHWAFPLFLLVDFYFRGFHNGQYSLLGWLSGFVVKTFALKNRPIDRAPKRFAAQIGFLFCDMLFITSILELQDISFYIGVVMVVFSFLESFFGLCVGCYVYNFLKMFKKPQQQA